MTRVKSDDYHDYVIKDGRLVGAFEEMYRDHADPWSCDSHSANFDNDLFVAGVRRIMPAGGALLDIGCGLGALSARLRREIPAIGQMGAWDISAEAIARADAQWNASEGKKIAFAVSDVRQSETRLPAELDAVSMAQIIWYILPEFDAILRKIRAALKPAGHLAILQSFLPPERQGYGKEYMTGPADLVSLITRAGFTSVAEAVIGRTPPNNFLLIARKSA
jgi:SAM-dependent methyltransferase